MLVLDNLARRVRRSATASATAYVASGPCPFRAAATWVIRVAVVQPCLRLWQWCRSVWIASAAVMERHLSDVIMFDWYVSEGRKRATAVYNACSMVFVAVLLLSLLRTGLLDGATLSPLLLSSSVCWASASLLAFFLALLRFWCCRRSCSCCSTRVSSLGLQCCCRYLPFWCTRWLRGLMRVG